MVKPEGGDDGFPQMRRPQSTGNGPDSMTPGTPHSAHPPPYADDKRHMSFDSGPSGMYRPSYPPPPTPVQHTQPYDYPTAYGPPPGEIAYAGLQYAPAAAKKKAQRASQVRFPALPLFDPNFGTDPRYHRPAIIAGLSKPNAMR